MKQVTRLGFLQPAIWRNAAESIPAVISSPTIRIHKSWRAAFIVLLVLLKVLMGFCVYYYIKAEMATAAAASQPALHAQP